jgi:metal-responsive CopG/Arc/MetJ family transcriptional regulator
MLGVATFTLYLPDALLAELDDLRGDVSRSAAIRGSLEAALTLARAEVAATGRPLSVGEPDAAAQGVAISELQRPSRSEMFARATQKRS